MNKLVKYALLGIAALVALAVAGVAYLAATFDPNDYKPQIIRAVKDNQQRNLRLDGDIKLTYFPSLGFDLGKVSLSEFESDKEFISVENVHVSLALMPLLSKMAVVDEVVIKGLKATLVKHDDGRLNIDDLLVNTSGDQAGAPAAAPVQFNIAAVHIVDTELNYLDESVGSQYSLNNINLKTGRIANDVASEIDFSADFKSTRPEVDVAVGLEAKLKFNLEDKSVNVQGLDLRINGDALDINSLKVQASGNASGNLEVREFSASDIKISVTGIKGKDAVEAKLGITKLNYGQDKFASGKVTVDATLAGGMGNMVAKLVLPELSGDMESFGSNATLSLEVMQPAQNFKVKLSSPLQVSLNNKTFNLSKMVLAVNATGDRLPGKSVGSEMKGSMLLDAVNQTVQANLAGGLLQSKVAAKLAVNGFENPVVRFDVDVDQFDADLYMSKAVDGRVATTEISPDEPDLPLDLSALKQLDLEGGLRIGTLKVANVKLARVRLEMTALNGSLVINPLSANLYQGEFNGSLSVNAQQAVPVFSIRQDVNGINLGALLKDAAGLGTVQGKGSASLNLNTRGNTVGALRNAVSGRLTISLSNAEFKQDGKTYSGEAKGSVQIDGGKQDLQADLSGRLDQSKFTAKVGLNNFDDPAIRFDVDVDQLDADQYLPKEATGKDMRQAIPEEPIDLSGLNKLNAEGGLRIGSFKVMNIKMDKVRVEMKAHKGVVSVNPLAANLYQGSMKGSISIDAQATPSFTINEKLSGVSIAPLIKDMLDFDAVEGAGNVTLNLDTQGKVVSALKKGLRGDASLDLANGAIKGINLTKLMENAQNIGKGATTQTLGVSENEKTEFSEFKASFTVKDGVAHNDDLAVKSPQLTLSGSGDVDIGNDSLDYTARATLQKSVGGDSLMMPVQLSGPYTNLKFKLDYTAMLQDLARRKIESRAEEIKKKVVDDAKTRLQEELEKGLKGLFK